MTGIITAAVAGIIKAIAALYGWIVERIRLRNTAEVRERARRQADQDLKDQEAKILADRDLERARKELSE